MCYLKLIQPNKFSKFPKLLGKKGVTMRTHTPIRICSYNLRCYSISTIWAGDVYVHLNKRDREEDPPSRKYIRLPIKKWQSHHAGDPKKHHLPIRQQRDLMDVEETEKNWLSHIRRPCMVYQQKRAQGARVIGIPGDLELRVKERISLTPILPSACESLILSPLI